MSSLSGQVKKFYRRNKKRWEIHKFAKQCPQIIKTIDSVHEEKLTYLSRLAMVELANAAISQQNSVSGCFVEAGCALGGSAIVLAAAKASSTPLYVYDCFEVIPPPGENDPEEAHERYSKIESRESEGIDGNEYYGYQEDLYKKVSDTFEHYGFDREAESIKMIKGLFEDTFHPDSPVSLAHIDCDWYQSVQNLPASSSTFLSFLAESLS